MFNVMVLPLKVIACAWTAALRLPHPVTSVGVMVGVSVIVGVSVMVGVIVSVGVMLGVSVNSGVFVGVSVGVSVGVNVGVSTVAVAVGVFGKKVEGGTVTTIDTLTKMVRALSATIGLPVSTERLIKGISLGTMGR